MSGRYSKVLTWKNVQLFVGGFMLSGTSGYILLEPRIRVNRELEEHLERIRQNMYWSMSLLQRDKPRTYPRSQEMSRSHWSIRWWNAQIYRFNGWISEPGLIINTASSLGTLASAGAQYGWKEIKCSTGDGARWVSGRVLRSIQETGIPDKIRDAWDDEKSKWRDAHTCAINTVHPQYTKKNPDDTSK